MTRRTLALTAALLSTSVFGIAGCSTAFSTDSSDADSEAGPTPSASARQSSPLDPYLDIIYLRISDAEYRAQFTRIEDELATCMQAAGFDYVPRADAYLDAEKAIQKTPDGTREWVAENGYGFNISDGGQGAAVVAADPNSAVVEGLSEGSQRAYYEALWGNQNIVGEGGTTGCYGSIDSGEQPLSLSERYAPLVESIDRLLSETIPRAEGSIAAEADWSECMAGAGYPSLPTRLAAQEKGAQVTEPGLSAPMPGGDPAKLEVEIAIALADFDCAAETDYDRRIAAVELVAETEFVAQNKAQLDALVAEAEQGATP